MSISCKFIIQYKQFLFLTINPPQMSFQNPRKKINDFSYLTINKIGNGCSCEVYRGQNEKTGQTVAIKVVPKLTLENNEQDEMAEIQIDSLQILKNEANILRLKQVIRTRNSVYIVTELCEKGSLAQILKQEGKMCQSQAINILQQIINGYKSLVKHRIVHRDIKPLNIFINSHNQVKIGDFGFAMGIQECKQSTKQNIGSPLYMPYEALTQNQYCFKSDIWAMGITFYEMLNGKTPWKSKTQNQLAHQLQTFRVQKMLSANLTSKSKLFLSRSLVKDVNQRMGIQQLFNFQFQSNNQQPSKIIQCPLLKLKNNSIQNTVKDTEIIQQKLEKMQLEVVRHPSQNKFEQKSKFSHSHLQKNQLYIKKQDNEDSISTQEKTNATINHSKKQKNSGVQQNIPHTKRRNTLQKHKLIFESERKSDPNSNPPQITQQNQRTEKEILQQVQQQINYFRFIFKLFRKINQTIKTKDENIKLFKENLFSLIFSKIQQLQQLKYISHYLSKRVVGFKQTTQYSNIVKVLGQYRCKYQKQAERYNLVGRFKSERQFISLLTYVIRVMYENLCKIETNQKQLQRKKSLIFILQDLINLSRLYILQKQQNWKDFHQKSGVGKLLQCTSNPNIKECWLQIKNQFISLNRA